MDTTPTAPPVYVDNPGGYDQSYRPVTQQPQVQPLGLVQTSVVMMQPTGLPPAPRQWTSGICSCCMDISSCLCVWLCGPCYICQISKDMGEGCCMPCCIPPTSALAMLRLKLRTKHNIYGSISSDYCTSCCCWGCALCQLKRELDAIRATEDSSRQLQG